jgi:hypothetical protein
VRPKSITFVNNKETTVGASPMGGPTSWGHPYGWPQSSGQHYGWPQKWVAPQSKTIKMTMTMTMQCNDNAKSLNRLVSNRHAAHHKHVVALAPRLRQDKRSSAEHGRFGFRSTEPNVSVAGARSTDVELSREACLGSVPGTSGSQERAGGICS